MDRLAVAVGCRREYSGRVSIWQLKEGEQGERVDQAGDGAFARKVFEEADHKHL